MEIAQLYRGDIVLCALQGDYGKPRPAVVVQSDLFNSTHQSISLCPMSSHLVEAPLFRVNVSISKQSGLQKESQIMVDKVMSIKRDKITEKIGKLSQSELSGLNSALKTWLSL